MDKIEVQKRVLLWGKPLLLKLFDWDEKTKTFISNMDRLVIDFRQVDDCTFHLAKNCTLICGSNCNIESGNMCVFDVGEKCKFKTKGFCIFVIWLNCTFEKIGEGCIAVRRGRINDTFKLEEGEDIILDENSLDGISLYTGDGYSPD